MTFTFLILHSTINSWQVSEKLFIGDINLNEYSTSLNYNNRNLIWKETNLII